MREINIRQAIGEALDEEMVQDMANNSIEKSAKFHA